MSSHEALCRDATCPHRAIVITLWQTPPPSFGPCFECRDGDCSRCIGVPCDCPCPPPPREVRHG